jgi:hypothetical protein
MAATPSGPRNSMAEAVPSGMRATASMNASVSTAVMTPSSTAPRSAGQLIARGRGLVTSSRISAAMASRSHAEPAGVTAWNRRVLKAAPAWTQAIAVRARADAGTFMDPFDRTQTLHVQCSFMDRLSTKYG